MSNPAPLVALPAPSSTPVRQSKTFTSPVFQLEGVLHNESISSFSLSLSNLLRPRGGLLSVTIGLDRTSPCSAAARKPHSGAVRGFHPLAAL